MSENYQFEKIRLYAIFSFLFMSLIYIDISNFFMLSQNIKHGPSNSLIVTLIAFGIFNLIRYRYLNTLKFDSDWVFLMYGSIDLFYLSYYFNIPALDQGGKVVIMFILIIASIYRGRVVGITLTLLWFPIKMVSDFIFMQLIKGPGNHDFDKMMNYEHIIEAIYFQVMLLILVFITDLIYRQITNKEKENKRLYNKLELHFKELNVAHDQIEAKNDRLNNANSDLKNVNKQLAHSIAEFFTLQQISQAIGSILDTDELIAYVNDITLGVMGVKNSTIILFNQNNFNLEVHTTNITDESDYALLCDNVNDKALLSILEGGSVVCENNVDSKKFIFTVGRNVKSFICVPISSKLKRLGLILIEQNFENAFDNDNVRLFTVIAQQVGMAMENADLYSEMHELAITDNLTGAYNRTYFHTIIKSELINAEKDCYDIAVAMLDIDNFKRVNDTYGHLFGDKVLKNIAALINKSIQSNDVMARFGGEEFIILFPRTSLTEAYEIVEELRKKIASTDIKDDTVCVSISASFGVACFPQNSSNIVELLKNADDALYDAKNSGRNCVRVFKSKENE